MTAPADIIQGAIWSGLSIYSGSEALGTVISEQDWSRMIGPHGALFLACVGLILMWTNNRRRERREEAKSAREEAAREARHAEQMTLQQANADKLMELTAESIKAHRMSVGAIKSMDRTIMLLTEELKDRPCQKIPKTAA